MRVNIHGIVTVASASLVEKKADAANESVEMENSNDNVQNNQQEAPMETNGSQESQPNGSESQSTEVRDDDVSEEPQQKQSWTQKVGQWFSGVRVDSACDKWFCVVCCRFSKSFWKLW